MTIDTHDGTDGRDHMADLIAEADERATPEDTTHSLTWNRLGCWFLGLAVGAGLALLLGGCTPVDDGRRSIAEVACDGGECRGRWEGSDVWSRVLLVSELEALPEADPAQVWGCDPDPDVDVCVVADDHGRLGCFRVDCSFAVAVAPACAGLDWLDVGNGMSARGL